MVWGRKKKPATDKPTWNQEDYHKDFAWGDGVDAVERLIVGRAGSSSDRQEQQRR